MSIFPKHIASGENVIIHLRFNNSKKNTKEITYYLKVFNPNNKIIYDKSDNIIVGYGDNDYCNEIYHSIMIKNNFVPGKYIVDFYMNINGKKIESITKNNDFFYVEKIKYFKKDNKTIINNMSKEKVKCSLYGLTKKTIELNGKEKIELDDSYNLIEYGNNQIYPIELNAGEKNE